jgi:thiamine biosynthesis lipoprotein
MGNPAAARKLRVDAARDYARVAFDAMASPCEILVEGAGQAEAEGLGRLAADEAWRIEAKFSRYLAGNVVDRINGAAGQAVEVDAETAELIDFATTLYELSEYRFDITSGVLRQAWTFDGSDRLPTPEAVAAIMDRVGWHRAEWHRPVLRMPPGMEIDLGGIGKEYAVDKAAAILRAATPRSCLVNFGGDLDVTCPPETFEYWSVGVESARTSGPVPASLLRLRVGALATSGDARRYLVKAGRRYCHILDPLTGWPVPDAPRSITVAADTCTQAGMLSTLAMLRGAGAEAFLDAQGVRYWCNR